MKKHTLLRGAAALLAFAGLSVAYFGCGSGLLDTEDDDLPNSKVALSFTDTEKALSGAFGESTETELSIVLYNGDFSDAFATAAGTANNDLTSYFKVDASVPLSNAKIVSKTYAKVDGGIDKDKDGNLLNTYTMKSITVTADLSATIEAAGVNGDLKLTLLGTALKVGRDTTASVGRYVFEAGKNELLTPTAEAMNAVIATKSNYTGLVAAGYAQISVPTAKAITAGTKLGSGTAGSTAFEVYAAANLGEKKVKLPLAIVAKDSTAAFYTGKVSFTLDASDAITSAATFENADSKCFRVPYYAQDYEAADATGDWTEGVSGAYTPILATVDSSKVLTVNGYESSGTERQQNNRWIYSGSTCGKAPSGNFVLSFDMKIANGNNQSGAGFYIFDSTISETNVSNTELTNAIAADGTGPQTLFYDFPTNKKDNVLFSLVATEPSTENWSINGSDAVTLSTTFSYSSSSRNQLSSMTWFTVTIERSGNDTYVTVAKRDGSGTPFARQKVSASANGIGAMMFTTGRYFANLALDNMYIYLSE